MEKTFWGYKTVAVLPDNSGMYRVAYGRLSDLGQWKKAARDEFEKRQSVACPTVCFEITKEEFERWDVDGNPRGYVVDAGDTEGPVQFVDEWAPA